MDGKQEATKDARAVANCENESKKPAAAVDFVKVVQEVGALGDDLVSDLQQIGDTLAQQHHRINKIDIGDNTSSLFEKTARALFSSVMIYAIADIRKLLRNHEDEVQGEPLLLKDFMELPISDVRIMKVVHRNFDLLQKTMKKCDIEMYISAIQRYGNEVQKQVALELDPKNNRRRNRRSSIYQNLQKLVPVELRVFDDSNSTKELVYSLEVDR
jgi:hypothetical protein